VAGPRAEETRMTLAAQPDALAVVDARGDVDFHGALLEHPAGAAALAAGRLDQPAAAGARRAGLGAHELAEDAPRDLLHPADPVAGRARAHRRPGLGAVTVAARARDRHLERHLARRAGRRLDELDLDRRAEVGAARAAAEEVVAEERGEEIREAAEVEMPRLEAAAPQAGVAVAVVELTRLRLREHLVGFDDLAEALLGVRRSRHVGVELARERAERLLDLALARVAPDAEKLVVVALGRCHSC